jgi:hypothetical protein
VTTAIEPRVPDAAIVNVEEAGVELVLPTFTVPRSPEDGVTGVWPAVLTLNVWVA